MWYFDQSRFDQYKPASTHFDQTPSFSNSEFSVLSVVQNEKLGAGKPREFDQSTHSLIKMLQRKIRGFHLRVFCFGYSAKWKTRSGKASERYSPRFSSFRPHQWVNVKRQKRKWRLSNCKLRPDKVLSIFEHKRAWRPSVHNLTQVRLARAVMWMNLKVKPHTRFF